WEVMVQHLRARPRDALGYKLRALPHHIRQRSNRCASCGMSLSQSISLTTQLLRASGTRVAILDLGEVLLKVSKLAFAFIDRQAVRVRLPCEGRLPVNQISCVDAVEHCGRDLLVESSKLLLDRPTRSFGPINLNLGRSDLLLQ